MPSRLHLRRRQRRNRARMRWKQKKTALRRQSCEKLNRPSRRRRQRRRRRHGRLTRRETWNSLNLKRGPGRMRKLRGLPCGERSGALWRRSEERRVGKECGGRGVEEEE